MNQNLNFSAFSAKQISQKDFSQEELIAAGFNSYKYDNLRKLIIGMMFVIFGVGLSIVCFLGGEIVGGFCGLAGFIFGLYALFFGEDPRYRLLRFALDNNWQISFKPPQKSDHDLPMIMQVGRERTINYSLGNPIDQQTIFSRFSYVVDYGKSQQTKYFSYAEITLSRNLPHLILNSRSNFFGVDAFGLKVAKLKFEGDFDRFFRVLMPIGYERDALQILTPDVMVVLQNFAEFDFEIFDNKIFIVSNKSDLLMKEEGLKRIIEAAAKIREEIDKQAKTYSDDNVPRSSVGENGAFVAASADNRVAKEGQRITLSWKVVLLVVVPFIIYGIFWLLSLIFDKK